MSCGVPAPAALPRGSLPRSAAVEDVVAEVLHFEDRDIGAALYRLRQMRLGDLADDDVVVALFDDAGHLALDRGEGGVEDRSAVRALVDLLSGQLAAFELSRLEEG